MMKFQLLVFTLVLSSAAFAEKNVAVVKMMRGEVDVLTLGRTIKLKVDDWVEDGSVVKTGEKSFAKLVFIDKSQMNIGPNSEMKIEKFSGEDAGVIDLVKGQIRSQVTKDYLQMKDKNKSKLFIKTPTAVMGVRGTDFHIATNGVNTTAILFEGAIVFNRLDSRDVNGSSALEDVVNRGVQIQPGQFSAVQNDLQRPTEPAKMNLEQIHQLEKNPEFDTSRAPSNEHKNDVKSVVPQGLNGEVVSNSTETLKSAVAEVVTVTPDAKVDNSDASGFVSGDKVKPANGSFVHLESGTIIPPGPGSILDKNTNTFIPAPTDGKVGADGNYIPPKNVEITVEGKILVSVTQANGEVKVHEAPKPSVVANITPVLQAPHGPGPIAGPAPAAVNGLPGTHAQILDTLKFNPGGLSPALNNQFNQTGGVNTVNDAVINNTNSDILRQRTINVNPK